MTDVWNEYEEKVNDIQHYLQYLRENENNIPQNIIKIQKANIFLMLYNLVESTINKSLEETHNKIIQDNIKFKDCIDEIKALWIEFKHKKFDQTKSKDIVQKILNINEDIIHIPYNEYQKKKINNISGNLDARKIREYLDKYKIPYNKRVIGKRLKDIKDNRNRLAHGEVSFSELGKNYVLSDMINHYKECKLFLREYLQNVERYIQQKKYLQSVS